MTTSCLQCLMLPDLAKCTSSQTNTCHFLFVYILSTLSSIHLSICRDLIPSNRLSEFQSFILWHWFAFLSTFCWCVMRDCCFPKFLYFHLIWRKRFKIKKKSSASVSRYRNIIGSGRAHQLCVVTDDQDGFPLEQQLWRNCQQCSGNKARQALYLAEFS